MNGCRVWELKMHDLDSELRSFQDCLLLQNFGAGAMNAIDHSISSDSPSAVAGREAGGAEEKRPNNGIIILVAHGLGGILAQGLASLILELPAEILKGHHLGLKRKHWRLLLLGAPNLPDHTNILEDWDQIQGIVSYYGGKGGDVHHTRDFWKGLHQHSLCLIDNGWIRQGLDAPLEPHGTLMVASFREGVEDERLVRRLVQCWDLMELHVERIWLTIQGQREEAHVAQRPRNQWLRRPRQLFPLWWKGHVRLWHG